MQDILLAGAYGQANPGDEALLAAFLTHLDRDRVVVTSRTPEETQARWGCAAVTPTAASVGAWLREGRHLVIGGGTLFKALHPSSGRRPHSLLVRTLGLIHAARARGITVSIVGVGAADLPSSTARRLARSIANNADLLVVRDEESAAVLADAGVPVPIRVGADAAWALFAHDETTVIDLRDQPDVAPGEKPQFPLAARPQPRPARSLGADGPQVLVALSHLAGGSDFVDRLAEALNQIDTEGRSITLQPWQHDDNALDHALAVELAARLGPHASTLAPPRDLHDAVATSARHDLVVGLRFHSLVAAASAGVRFVAIAHEPKLAGIADHFGQLAVPPHASAAVLARSVTLGIEQAPPDPAVVSDEIAKADEAFQLLRLIISDGATADEGPPRTRLALSTGGSRW